MILESLIQDESKLTLDCAKATLHKGSRIDIPDIHWNSKEVQGAINAGLVVLRGEPPILPEEPKKDTKEATTRFRNNFTTKLTFECIKNYADPHEIVHVPNSKIDEKEIRNAIAAGWLVNVDHPELTPERTMGPCVYLEELTTKDIVDGILNTDVGADIGSVMTKPMVDKPLPADVPAERPNKKAQSQIKAKRIGKGEIDEEGGGDDLYKPSEVIVPKTPGTKRPAPRAMPLMVEDTETEDKSGEDDFDFTDIFSNKDK